MNKRGRACPLPTAWDGPKHKDLLWHYGTPGSSRHILIDGGSRGTYRDVLKPRLDALRSGGKALPLSLVVSTQTDMEHMQGLIDLVEDLQQHTSASPSVTIDALWSNAFVPGPPEMAPALVSLQPKGRLVAGAKNLRVPVNEPFTRMVAAPEAGAARVRLDEQLTITVLSPRVQWLRAFAKFWLAKWRTYAQRPDVDPRLLAVLNDYDILEMFADAKIELLPSPIRSSIRRTCQVRTDL